MLHLTSITITTLILNITEKFTLTEVKGASEVSGTGAKIGDAKLKLENGVKALKDKLPSAKIGRIEVAVPKGAPLEPTYEVSGDQIIQVTAEGTEVVRVAGKALKIIRY